MEFLSGTAIELKPDLVAGLGRYRHRVFVENLGWDLATKEGLEFDQFDRPDTRYVVGRDHHGCIIGVARLLPTSRAYLLGEVFPQLMGNHPLPCADDVWELSRFAAVNFESAAVGQFSSPNAIELLHAVQWCAVQQGVRRLITVSPLGVERLLRRAGFDSHRAGPPIIVGGHPLFACWIELPTALMAR